MPDDTVSSPSEMAMGRLLELVKADADLSLAVKEALAVDLTRHPFTSFDALLSVLEEKNHG